MPQTALQSEQSISCTICDLSPPSLFFQCSKNHLICNPCFNNIKLAISPRCPTCRIPLDLAKPVRNLVVEQIISSQITTCPFEDCQTQLTHAHISTHIKTCNKRPSFCVFRPFGCNWFGNFETKDLHEKMCSLSSLTLHELESKNPKLIKRLNNLYIKSSFKKNELKFLNLIKDRVKNIEVCNIWFKKDLYSSTLYKCLNSYYDIIKIIFDLSLIVKKEKLEGKTKLSLTFRLFHSDAWGSKKSTKFSVVILRGVEMEYYQFLDPIIFEIEGNKSSNHLEKRLVFHSKPSKTENGEIMENEDFNYGLESFGDENILKFKLAFFDFSEGIANTFSNVGLADKNNISLVDESGDLVVTKGDDPKLAREVEKPKEMLVVNEEESEGTEEEESGSLEVSN